MDNIDELKAENDKLKSMNSVKSDLISISAHQLRTSLTALKWILKMFTDKDLGELTTEQEGFMEKAVESNERMIALVNDLLTLNHADDTTIKFNFQKVDLVSLIEQAMFEFSGETHKKGIELTFSKPDTNIPEVNCDREMIRVVFQNLIENGIKYSRENDKVTISISQVENNVEIKVHDTGIGIALVDQVNIFNKFFRATNAIDKDHIGSGLGLFTTKNIVERHKGKIRFESAPEKGTTFFVTLPTSLAL
jgi:signal transduction histidine kinase